MRRTLARRGDVERAPEDRLGASEIVGAQEGVAEVDLTVCCQVIHVLGQRHVNRVTHERRRPLGFAEIADGGSFDEAQPDFLIAVAEARAIVNASSITGSASFSRLRRSSRLARSSSVCVTPSMLPAIR